MSAQPARTDWTAAEYLAFERESPERHEFHHGELFAMAGAKRRHNLVAANLQAELRQALRDRPCESYQSDMKVQVEASERYVYPDVVAVFGPRFLDEEQDTLLNPQVVAEVLSDSTEAYDRGDKFALYRGLPSVTDYLLVSQKAVLLEHYARQADGTWLLRELRQGDRLRIASLQVELPIDEIYLKVFAEEVSR